MGQKLIQILGDGNCFFRELPYAVSGRQVYYTRVRAQIINHMRHIESCLLLLNINSSLDSYLANGQTARNKVRVKGIEILRAASLLSTADNFCLHLIWGYIQMTVRKPSSSKTNSLRPVRVFHINCNPLPPPPQSSN